MRTFHLGPMTLGPAFETQTESTLPIYIESLKLERSIGKIKSIPRIKKVPQIHQMNGHSKCVVCLKKVRSVNGKCSGPPKKPLQPESTSDSTI